AVGDPPPLLSARPPFCSCVDPPSPTGGAPVAASAVLSPPLLPRAPGAPPLLSKPSCSTSTGKLPTAAAAPPPRSASRSPKSSSPDPAADRSSPRFAERLFPPSSASRSLSLLAAYFSEELSERPWPETPRPPPPPPPPPSIGGRRSKSEKNGFDFSAASAAAAGAAAGARRRHEQPEPPEKPR
ncbi:unnamed protein product, partial [Scytosiphon promiscuus]